MALGPIFEGTNMLAQDSPYIVLALSVGVLSAVLYVIYTVMNNSCNDSSEHS